MNQELWDSLLELIKREYGSGAKILKGNIDYGDNVVYIFGVIEQPVQEMPNEIL